MSASFASKPKVWGNNNPKNWVLDGDIFSKDSPKAYAPLGYGTLTEPSVVSPEDFNNDMKLPSYEERLPLRVSKPLGATFVDTESEKPDDSRLSRRPVLRDDSASVSSKSDPTARIVREKRAHRTTLMLGKTVLSEDSSLVTNRVYLDKILKRKGGSGDEDGSADTDGDKKKARLGSCGSSSGDEREHDHGARRANSGGSLRATGAESSARGNMNSKSTNFGGNSNNGPSRPDGKASDGTSGKIATNRATKTSGESNVAEVKDEGDDNDVNGMGHETKLKVEDEDDIYGSNEHTVAPETVLRMVDQSLVETPEKARK